MTKARWRGLLLAGLLCLTAAGCRDKARYLVVTKITHFALYGNGNALNLPLFAGQPDADKIVRDVTLAEYYYQTLASVYGPKAYTFLADSAVELLLEHAGDLRVAQPVYGYQGAKAQLDLLAGLVFGKHGGIPVPRDGHRHGTGASPYRAGARRAVGIGGDALRFRGKPRSHCGDRGQGAGRHATASRRTVWPRFCARRTGCRGTPPRRPFAPVISAGWTNCAAHARCACP